MLFHTHPKAATLKIPDNSTLSIAASILDSVTLLSSTALLWPTTLPNPPPEIPTTKLGQFEETPRGNWIPNAKPTNMEATIGAPNPTLILPNTHIAAISAVSTTKIEATTHQASPTSMAVSLQRAEAPKSQKLAVPPSVPTSVVRPLGPILDIPTRSIPRAGVPTKVPIIDKEGGHNDEEEEEEEDDDDEEEEDDVEDADVHSSRCSTHPSPSSVPSPGKLGEEEDLEEEDWEENEDEDNYDDGFLRSKKRLSRHRTLVPSQLKKQSDMESNDAAKTHRNPASELDQWIDDTVDQQSAFYEAEVVEVIDKLLQEIVSSPKGYSSDIDGLADSRQRLEQEQRLEQNGPHPNTSNDNKVSDTPPPRSAVITFVEKLARPFILQLRTDIRNVLIWICFGAVGSPIDGKIRGSTDISDKEAVNDKIAVTHENGTLFLQDIFDPRVATLALDCLTFHFKTLLTEIQSLFWTRLNDAKEFLLEQVRSLIPLPRFLIPFSDEIGQGEIMVEVQEDENAGVEGTNGELSVSQQMRLEQEQETGRQKPEDAFARWLVANVMTELKVNTDSSASIQKTAEWRKARSRNREEASSSAAPLSSECAWLRDRLLK
ncbi:hypothetical protein EMPS_05751 [Entomortierella parvispora]|uniref:Uncharacterized protein n=1 Tax=Entomortierella parvispora TaxID=205924 RepID=A0A9P3HBE7_9FUNG|nr:hypothetical protein EMPS_05751 [Entomortierella parvispora]